MQSTYTLSVQASILGKGLADDDRDGLAGYKVPDRVGVPVEVSRSETLVSAVKESQVLLPFEDVADCVPLLFGRVYASWVVSAGMEEKDGALGCRFERICETLVVQTDCPCVILFDPVVRATDVRPRSNIRKS